MDAPYFTFQPGEFVEVADSLGNSNLRIGRISGVHTNSVSVTWWEEDVSVPGLDKLLLPKFLRPTSEGDVIPIPPISSIEFVFHQNMIAAFRVRYVHGMKNVFATAGLLQWYLTCQSISYIIFDCTSRISTALQRVLSNRRINQFSCLSTSVQCSHLAWKYLVEKLDSYVVANTKVCTLSTMRSNDLSMVKVKAKVPCQVIRLEGIDVMKRLIGVLGTSAVVGVRKALPTISKKLDNSDDGFVVARGGVQLKDVINLIDVSSNNLPARQRFRWNANGRCGIDLVFFPTQCSLRISIRYRNFTVSRAIDKLRELGVGTVDNQGDDLNDEELERLLRG